MPKPTILFPTALLLAGIIVLLSPAVAPAGQFYHLYTAIARNDLAAVKRLTPNSGSINSIDRSSGATPLTWASMRGIKPEIAAWLISKGADLEKRDGEGETPLTTAALYGNHQVVRLLLAKGANPHTPNDRGTPPIILACGQHGHLEAVKLLAAGEVGIQGKLGIEAIETARAFHKTEIVQYLREKGIRPSYFKALKKFYPGNPVVRTNPARRKSK